MHEQVSGSFFNKVYQVVKLIPPGRVTTYGAIAHYLGVKKSARMVGWALNKIKYQQDIPAHRVLNGQGLLTGKQHFATATSMEQLLHQEGIKVRNNQVQHFETLFWSPEQLEIT